MLAAPAPRPSWSGATSRRARASSDIPARWDTRPTLRTSLAALGSGRAEWLAYYVEAALKRQPPDITALLGVLNEHGVRYVVTGSAAAMLHGVDLEPGDLDITPARDELNLRRLALVLEAIAAQQDPDAPFGEWEIGADGEQSWVQREATPQDVASRASWKPDPFDPATFDHLLESRYGAIDIVPEVAAPYEGLVPSAVAIEAHGLRVWVEAIHDLLATITVPRREKIEARVQHLRALQGAALRADSEPSSKSPNLGRAREDC